MTSTTRLNEKFIQLMETLADIMTKRGEPFRARAYQKAQGTIISFPEDIFHYEQLKGKPSIGPAIMEKLCEYVEKGTVDIIEREKNNPVTILSDVYGIGPKKAEELVNKGITSIAKLRENQQLLNDIQRVGLHYYEDVLKRIPRSEIEKYKQIFTSSFQESQIEGVKKFEIVGSYRRGAETSGDIDIIITSNNPQVYHHFIDTLIKKNIIYEVLSRGPTKCLVIAKINESESFRRVDFLYTSSDEFPFAILYFTGSKIFNTVMRQRALDMGLSMNENGLYHLKEGNKEKVDFVFKTEKDIFDYLKIEYKLPEERKDGRSVVLLSSSTFLDEKIISKNQLQTFKHSGLPFLQTLNEIQLTNMYEHANQLYRNDQPILTDNEFDILEDYIKVVYPKNNIIKQVGAQPNERNKVTLPYTMGSMDKIKPDTNAIINWQLKYKGPYVLSCKLDGVSGLYSTEGPVPKLYTRGDGNIGQDISHFIPYLKLPKTQKGLVIRGEFIISKVIFEEKYKTKFANPRNMVAGIMNQKTINDSIQDVRFVAYELIKPQNKPSEQLRLLSTLVETVFYKVSTTITNELLSKYLIELRKKYNYEIDGIIVSNDLIYERKKGNPEHSFAFKMVLTDQIAEAKVVDVIWTPSKDGYLKPRVRIEPIQLGGVCIEYATGFNGSYIKENKIGVGALIEIIRSGDVIPHIRNTIIPAEKAKMPDVPFKWNETNIDIILENSELDETVREKIITGFFRGIEVDSLSSGNITRIMKAGFDSIPKILKMTLADFLGVEGFQLKMATKIYSGIHDKIEASSLITLMAASNLFGRGFSDKKIELVINSYPDILVSKESSIIKINKITDIKGFAKKTAEAFVNKIPEFIEFIKECGLQDKLTLSSLVIEQNQFNPLNPLFGKTIVMTGFRDQALQKSLQLCGAKIGASVSKNTFAVLVKDKAEDTTKANEARKLNIPLMTPAEFNEKYINNENTQKINT
jgi:NAD-dependent DNA ligase